LDKELVAFNIQATDPDDQHGLTVSVTDDAGELIAGLAGWIWGDCSGITSLWVHEQLHRDRTHPRHLRRPRRRSLLETPRRHTAP
jgi:hypothetical protein